MSDTEIITGTLVSDPSIRYTAAGAAVTTLRAKVTREIEIKVGGRQAENVALTLAQGDAVLVAVEIGDDGGMVAIDIGPSLRNATAEITRDRDN